jgi:hypothetical protein
MRHEDSRLGFTPLWLGFKRIDRPVQTDVRVKARTS